MRAIRGGGFVARVPSHFAVLVIGALAAAYFKSRPEPVSQEIGQAAIRCNESVVALRADFVQFKAETSLHNAQTEHDINQLLIRIPAK